MAQVASVNAGRARNVNTIDEVPDSSWYTNRAGSRPLTAADVFTGPDTTAGPEPGTWTVTSSKSDGVTPGFTSKDAKGQLWFLKFDPPGYRGMATGTEVAVTKLMWALGYHVAENHIAYMHRERLAIGRDVELLGPSDTSDSGGVSVNILAKVGLTALGPADYNRLFYYVMLALAAVSMPSGSTGGSRS